MDKIHQQQLLKELFEHATESILVTNETGKIQLINPAAEKVFGYSLVELENKTVEQLIPERFARNHSHHREQFNKNPHGRGMGIGMDLLLLLLLILLNEN